jgi:hypothetical protein
MNRNLHTIDCLTEFARESADDEEQSTIFTKLKNRITNVYNANYNSFNSLAGGENVVENAAATSPVVANTPCISPDLKESSPSMTSDTSSNTEYLEKASSRNLTFGWFF